VTYLHVYDALCCLSTDCTQSDAVCHDINTLQQTSTHCNRLCAALHTVCCNVLSCAVLPFIHHKTPITGGKVAKSTQIYFRVPVSKHSNTLYWLRYLNFYSTQHNSVIKTQLIVLSYRVATISRLLKIIGLFCKRAPQKRLYSAKETNNYKEPTKRSHPITQFPPLVSSVARVLMRLENCKCH